MTRIKPYAWFTAIVVFLALAELITTHAERAGVRPPPAQDTEKTLDIERYPDEPLELVALKIGAQPVKDKIKTKTRKNKEGLDTVKFKEKAGWFKRVTARLRNVSGQPITGLQAFLYFQPLGERRLFSLPLTRSSNQFERGTLPPGAQISLSVREDVWSLIAEMIRQQGADAEMATVTLSVESVTFGDDLQWNRGQLLRRDPANPNRWTPTGAKVGARVKKPEKPAQFMTIGFKPTAPTLQSAQCKVNAGFQAWHCTMTGCFQFEDFPGAAGDKSQVPVTGVCLEINPQVDNPNINCTEQTTHLRLQDDPSCPPPPDPGDCFNNDGDSYSTCDGDCNDEDPNIYPGCGCVEPNCNYTMWEGSDNLYGLCASCYDGVDNDCNGYTDLCDYQCIVCQSSPIVIDVLGDGFKLTNVADGVAFDINGDGTPEQLSWTAAGVDDAWLALDRNGNGSVDNGQELFGNFSPQPNPPPGIDRNGFNALAVYDRTDQGGNGDGLVNKQDTIFDALWLWQDANHNGVSEASELRTLKQLGLKSIDLDYKASKRKDQHGNWFRYRAKVRDNRDAQLGRWAWDVFLLREP